MDYRLSSATWSWCTRIEVIEYERLSFNRCFMPWAQLLVFLNMH